MMRPGLTTATQWSTPPLPEPMRVSAGLAVTGLSGNTRIHILPRRFISRTITRRTASICRAVTHAGSVACKPNSPASIVDPRIDLPVMRPRCCLRNFTRFGINIGLPRLYSATRPAYSADSAPSGRGPRSPSRRNPPRRSPLRPPPRRSRGVGCCVRVGRVTSSGCIFGRISPL